MGASLNELLDWRDGNGAVLKLTHRQMRMWQEHETMEWNRPSRTDHYLMRIAATILAVNHKDGKFPPAEDMKIPFVTVKSDGKQLEGTAEERNNRDPKFVPPPPGCPRTVRAEDISKVMSQGLYLKMKLMQGEDPGGAHPHPTAVKRMKPKYGVTE